MRQMRIYSAVLLFMLLLVSISFAEQNCDAIYGNGKHKFSLATGSPGELGMLKVIAEAFAKENDAAMCWIKAGSGESLKLLKEKRADMIMVHAPAAEKKAVSDGWAANHKLIGSNEFYIAGPADDPAKIAEAKNVADAYKRIASSKSKFFSRGDNSGTHKKEMDAWAKAGIAPSGDWYIVTKTFMTATLKRTDTEKGYFMTDSSTWVAERKNVPNLKILFRGDKFLINTYHTLSQPKGITAGADTAAKFIDYVISKKGQKLLRDYGRDKFDEGLYNDAAYAKQYDN
jgi:tungstate transport system substrate-binding protein